MPYVVAIEESGNIIARVEFEKESDMDLRTMEKRIAMGQVHHVLLEELHGVRVHRLEMRAGEVKEILTPEPPTPPTMEERMAAMETKMQAMENRP